MRVYNYAQIVPKQTYKYLHLRANVEANMRLTMFKAIARDAGIPTHLPVRNGAQGKYFTPADINRTPAPIITTTWSVERHMRKHRVCRMTCTYGGL